MAKAPVKKAAPKVAKKESIEEKLNKTEMYKQICESTSDCTAEKKHADLGNMVVLVCTQCLNKFGWEKKSIETPKKEKKEPEAKKSEKAPVEKPKEPVKEKVKESVAETEDDIIKQEAENTKKVFSDLDKLVEEVDAIQTPAAVQKAQKPAEEELALEDPFGEDEVQVEEDFAIVNFDVISETEVNLVCENKRNGRFIVKVTTSEAKVKVIKENPKMLLKYKARVQYKGIDSKGNPMNAEYLSMSK